MLVYLLLESGRPLKTDEKELWATCVNALNSLGDLQQELSSHIKDSAVVGKLYTEGMREVPA